RRRRSTSRCWATRGWSRPARPATCASTGRGPTGSRICAPRSRTSGRGASAACARRRRMADDAVVCELDIRAPAERVYAMFTDPAELVRWIGIRALLEPRPGGVFRFELAPGEFCSGRYLELVPPRRVVFTWGWES